MASSTERARHLKRRKVAAGLQQLNVWLPAKAFPEFKQAAEKIRREPNHLRIGALVDLRTGRLVSLR